MTLIVSSLVQNTYKIGNTVVELIGESEYVPPRLLHGLFKLIVDLYNVNVIPSKLSINCFLDVTATLYGQDGSRLLTISYMPGSVEIRWNPSKLSKDVIERIVKDLEQIVGVEVKSRELR